MKFKNNIVFVALLLASFGSAAEFNPPKLPPVRNIPLAPKNGLVRLQEIGQTQKITILCDAAETLYKGLAKTAEIEQVEADGKTFKRVANTTTACFVPVKDPVLRGDYFCQSRLNEETGTQEALSVPQLAENPFTTCLIDWNAVGVGTLNQIQNN